MGYNKINEYGFRELVRKFNYASHKVNTYYKLVMYEYFLYVNYDDIEVELLTVHREKMLELRGIEYGKLNLLAINEAVCAAYPLYADLFKLKDQILFHKRIKEETLLGINADLSSIQVIEKISRMRKESGDFDTV